MPLQECLRVQPHRLMRIGVEHFDALLAHKDQVLDAHAGASGQIDPRLDGKRHTGFHHGRVGKRDIARLMILHAN